MDRATSLLVDERGTTSPFARPPCLWRIISTMNPRGQLHRGRTPHTEASYWLPLLRDSRPFGTITQQQNSVAKRWRRKESTVSPPLPPPMSPRCRRHDCVPSSLSLPPVLPPPSALSPRCRRRRMFSKLPVAPERNCITFQSDRFRPISPTRSRRSSANASQCSSV